MTRYRIVRTVEALYFIPAGALLVAFVLVAGLGHVLVETSDTCLRLLRRSWDILEDLE